VNTNRSYWGTAGWSGLLLLFPFIEQTARFESFNSGTVINAWDTPVALREAVSSFLCPSCPGEGLSFEIGANVYGGQNAARTNYGFSRGDAAWDHDVLTWFPGSEERDNVRSRSMFNLQERKGMGAIADGTSNTLAMSEFVKPTEPQSRAVRGGLASRWMRPYHPAADGSADWPGWIRGCMDVSSDRRFFNAGVSVPTGPRQTRGGQLGTGTALIQGFSTMLPPNSPSCNSDVGGDTANRGVYSASSFHTAGVNGVFFDGSVRFITDTINFGATDSRQVREGQSLFGVWGALGTPDGGESVSL
jgi:hypothetical protein